MLLIMIPLLITATAISAKQANTPCLSWALAITDKESPSEWVILLYPPVLGLLKVSSFPWWQGDRTRAISVLVQSPATGKRRSIPQQDQHSAEIGDTRGWVGMTCINVFIIQSNTYTALINKQCDIAGDEWDPIEGDLKQNLPEDKTWLTHKWSWLNTLTCFGWRLEHHIPVCHTQLAGWVALLHNT